MVLLFFYFILLGFLSAEEPVIWHEDFSDNEAKWAVADNDTVMIKIENGNFVFQHKRTEGGYYAWNYSYLDDSEPFSIEITIKHLAGTDDYGYGLTWGMLDLDNYYSFDITSSGYYRIAKTDNGNWQAYVDWKASGYINTYGGSNKLGVKKVDEQLKFYINNSYVDQIAFEYFFDDGVGFAVWRNQTIAVDDLIIRGTEYYDDFEDYFYDWFDE